MAALEEFIDARDLKIDPELVRIAKAEFYEELVKSVAEPMPGALSLLSRTSKWRSLPLPHHRMKMRACFVLKALNIGSYFACIATRSSVARIKPFPDLFLYVGKELGEAPKNCLVLEDSEKA